MSAFKILFHMFSTICRLVIASWNACFVLHQVVRSVIREAERDAEELVALLSDGGPASGSLFHDVDVPVNPWQMLIIARVSSFVLLVQLSKSRVLQLEVDEDFIITKLEIICTELMSHIQHIPRLLRLPIGTHDTRLVRYTPILKWPYLWKEIQVEGRSSAPLSKAIIPADPVAVVSASNADMEGRDHRKKCVQLLTESAMRRRLHMDGPPAFLELVPKGRLGIVKTHDENVMKRKALANATNVNDNTYPEENADEGGAEELKTIVTDAVKLARVRTALSENLSIENLAHAATLRKAIENPSVQQPRRVQSLRRKRGQFNLYAQNVSSEFSLRSKMGGCD